MASAYAYRCTCNVNVSHPLTASQTMKTATMRTYTMSTYDSMNEANVDACRNECVQQFRRDLPPDELTPILVELSKQLIDQKVVGYNCTGLTSFKYPVRVKAKFGRRSLGNVADQIEVVTYEQVCFDEDY
jgi:hypothetical protein